MSDEKRVICGKCEHCCLIGGHMYHCLLIGTEVFAGDDCAMPDGVAYADSLHPRVAELEPLAEVGRLMEKLPESWEVLHRRDDTWLVWDGVYSIRRGVGATILDALREALPEAKKREEVQG